jgi:hypothetical protein
MRRFQKSEDLIPMGWADGYQEWLSDHLAKLNTYIPNFVNNELCTIIDKNTVKSEDTKQVRDQKKQIVKLAKALRTVRPLPDYYRFEFTGLNSSKPYKAGIEPFLGYCHRQNLLINFC